MPNQDDGHQTKEHVQTPTPPSVRSIRGVRYIKRKLQERRSKYEHETPADKAVRRTTTATIWIAVFTVLLAIVGGITLYEVIEGGADTHDLAVAAGKQADRTKDLADRMKDQADQTKIIADQAIIQAGAGGHLAQTATDTLRNTQKTFQAEQRAWVGVQEAAGISFSESTPWKVRVIFYNSGRTPARHVRTSGMYSTTASPVTEPSPDQIKQLIFRPTQSIAPQGRYIMNMGDSPPAQASTEIQRTGTRTLTSQFQAIKDGKLFLYYFGVLKYDDGFGRQRETQFCILLANTNTAEVGFCNGFNDLD